MLSDATSIMTSNESFVQQEVQKLYSGASNANQSEISPQGSLIPQQVLLGGGQGAPGSNARLIKQHQVLTASLSESQSSVMTSSHHESQGQSAAH